MQRRYWSAQVHLALTSGRLGSTIYRLGHVGDKLDHGLTKTEDRGGRLRSKC